VLEKAVVARIMAALKQIPGVAVRKRHGTAMGVAGDPDLYGAIRGRHFEIEVKRPNDPSSKLTKLQEIRLLEWKAGGAITGVARSSEEALEILGLGKLPPGAWLCSGCHNYRWEGSEPPARCPGCGHLHFEQEARR
jgi:rubrerythrin